MGVVISGFSVKETSYSIENNTSQVRILLTARSSGESHNFYGAYGCVKVDGNVAAEFAPNIDYNSSISLCDITVTAAHNTDGTKTVNVSYAWDTGISAGVLSGSADVALTTIPRASKIGTITDFNLEDSFSVPITKYSAGFTDNLTLKIGNTDIKTISGYENNASIVLTDSEILTAYNAISAANKTATVTFNLATFSGGSSIGTDSKTAVGTIAGTAQIKESGAWKRACAWIKVSGTWKRCIAHTKASGSWVRCK